MLLACLAYPSVCMTASSDFVDSALSCREIQRDCRIDEYLSTWNVCNHLDHPSTAILPVKPAAEPYDACMVPTSDISYHLEIQAVWYHQPSGMVLHLEAVDGRGLHVDDLRKGPVGIRENGCHRHR